MLFETAQEANAFLLNAKREGGFNFFSSELKTVDTIRKRERKRSKLNAADRQSLRVIYGGTANLVICSDRELFRKIVSEKEITLWLDHVAEILQQKVRDAYWINTGTLLKHDELLLRSFAELVFQPVAALMTFENTKILEIINAMLLSRQGDSNKLPGADSTACLTKIIAFLYATCTKVFDKPWTPYRFFRKLERTGLLLQYLRCSTIELAHDDMGRMKDLIFCALLRCKEFVAKRLVAGTDCGDTLRSILNRGDGATAICSRALPFFHSLVKLSMFPQTADCQYCEEGGLWDIYMHCAKCKLVNYCSRKCQRADWKEHKKVCCVVTDDAVKHNTRRYLPRSAITEILQGIYVEIMVQLVQDCDKAGGLEMKDMTLELNFCPEPSGIPLFQDPPHLRAVPIARYVDGTRPRECLQGLGWAEGEVEDYVRPLVKRLSEELSYGTPKPGLLAYELHPDCPEAFKSHSLFTDDGEPMFTQEALDAFRMALVDDNFSRLSALFQNQDVVESYTNRIRKLKTACFDFYHYPRLPLCFGTMIAGVKDTQMSIESLPFRCSVRFCLAIFCHLGNIS